METNSTLGTDTSSSIGMYIINYNSDMNIFSEDIESLIRKKQKLRTRATGKFRSVNPQVN